MDARVKLLGHSIHQISIVLPMGMITGVVIFDIAYLLLDQGRWADVAFWLIPVAVIGGLFSAVFGIIDWTGIPAGTRAKRIGIIHAAANVVALVLLAISFALRYDAPASPGFAEIAVAWIGAACAATGGWLGGELVTRLGIGVDDGAHPDAPSSLTNRRV